MHLTKDKSCRISTAIGQDNNITRASEPLKHSDYFLEPRGQSDDGCFDWN